MVELRRHAIIVSLLLTLRVFQVPRVTRVLQASQVSKVNYPMRRVRIPPSVISVLPVRHMMTMLHPQACKQTRRPSTQMVCDDGYVEPASYHVSEQSHDGQGCSQNEESIVLVNCVQYSVDAPISFDVMENFSEQFQFNSKRAMQEVRAELM